VGCDLQGETGKSVIMTILDPSQFLPNLMGATLIGASTNNCGEASTGHVSHRQIFGKRNGVVQPLGKVQPDQMLDMNQAFLF
jgi:hypothetical protein